MSRARTESAPTMSPMETAKHVPKHTACTDVHGTLEKRWSIPLSPFLTGRGECDVNDEGVRLTTTGASATSYSDAQLDDYQNLPRRRFGWSPPLLLNLTARFSGSQSELRGTAGFGFWNDPFMMSSRRPPALPRAVWFFFASPPSDMRLDPAVAGHGWKAATIDATGAGALVWAPLAPLWVALMNVPGLYRTLWPPVQRSLRIREAWLDVPMTEWHEYRLDWRCDVCRFFVDGRPILEAPSPGGRLGLVVWIDNQFMVVKPWGRFAWGLVDAPGEQWMEIRSLSIRRPDAGPDVSGGLRE